MTYKVKVVAGNRGKFVLRWLDHNGRQRQRTTDLESRPSNRRKAYALAEQLTAELSGDAIPNLMLSKRERSEENNESTPTFSEGLTGDWESYKHYFKETHLSGLSEGYAKTMMPILGKFERFANPKHLKEINAQRARKWIASLRDEGLADSTIRSYWRHLSAFLSIALDDGLIDSRPRIRLPKTKSKMKGRPFVGEQLDRIVAAVESIRPESEHTQWKWDIRALWFSGLRISEAYRITWHQSDFYIDLSGKSPCYMILGDQKNKEHLRLPIVPDFAELLNKPKRRGYVFSFVGKKGRLGFGRVKEVIADLGETAGIKTTNGKTATAHDFRRSFGTRWALKVMPQVLQKLMRHGSIQTTMDYYAYLDADMILESIQAQEDRPTKQVGDQLGDQKP